jgi:hypothetical protein
MTKDYKAFIGYKKAERFCWKNNIKNYTIHPDLTIDVDGNVDIGLIDSVKLPVRFGKVTGHFECDRMGLESLHGCPSEVGGDFYCYDNNLTSLEGCPRIVSGEFNFYGNKVKNFIGGPTEIHGPINFYKNNITSFVGFPTIRVNEPHIYLSNNPVGDVIELFHETQWVRAIESLNEWEVINGDEMTVSYMRLTEVYEELGMEIHGRDIYETIFDNYKLID